MYIYIFFLLRYYTKFKVINTNFTRFYEKQKKLKNILPSLTVSTRLCETKIKTCICAHNFAHRNLRRFIENVNG